MFSRNQIKHMVSKHRAICECNQCHSEYECNIYDAAKSKIGHLCFECKTQVTSLKNPTSDDLNRIFNYDPLTGILSYAQDSLSGLKADVAGYSHSEGYLSVSIGRKEYLVHRVIWCMVKGYWPIQVDHQNHIRSDNRWLNLEETSSRGNQLNMGLKRKNNSSGELGVRILPSGRFCAFIMVSRKQISLGTYDTLEEAKAARKAANRQYGFHDNHGN